MMHHFISLFKAKRLEIEGREMELLVFIISLEENRKKENQQLVNIDGEEKAVGLEAFL